ncbi:winged helix-turn-helix domain-containing protein [Syntrophorhabdus aromaticivorans]|uniref:LysR family transcriptional regulator n=1 Tax=Syntrophorhabdus aromaticivorans TaxID=328301 RepID=A0A351U1U3_9BACT|nr:LysR family transcriptional regulator [Syntrophorhabdus aromaticivorans]NLW35899.1 LysR family transcriptional regulator [Syntrophorhabdus aromaticivorans]HBA53924.1 molybdenum-binding protein [Syntrophorhabdus aromaticivorans]
MKLVYKIWLENKDSGGRVFGEGPYRLLRGIEATGSLWGAAAALGMAYSKARRIITSCERSLGFALTHRKAGGASGGGSEITAEATRLMKVYETLRADTEEVIAGVYKKCFGESIQVQFYTITPHKRGRKNLMG